MKTRSRSFLQLLCWTPVLVIIGCGSGNIGTVTGKVTAEGKPLAGATLQFYPEVSADANEGRSSAGVTGPDGTYELTYSRDTMGAEVGKHRVVITTGGGQSEGDYGKAAKETLPAKYNVDTQLTADVKSGSNVIDFDLDYEGKVVQPIGVTGY